MNEREKVKMEMKIDVIRGYNHEIHVLQAKLDKVKREKEIYVETFSKQHAISVYRLEPGKEFSHILEYNLHTQKVYFKEVMKVIKGLRKNNEYGFKVTRGNNTIEVRNDDRMPTIDELVDILTRKYINYTY